MREFRFAIVAVASLVTGSLASSYKPDIISLPTGFFPEGIDIGEDWTAYVGSVGGECVSCWFKPVS